jgi:hypothetical protein
MVKNLDFECTTSIKRKRDTLETPLLDASGKLIMPTLAKITLQGKVKGFA